MKKRVTFIVLVIFIIVLMLNVKSYAVTVPEFLITSHNYAVGDKMDSDEIQKIQMGKRLQLEEGETIQFYAVIGYGNDIIIDDDPNSLGWFVREINLDNVTWSSSDNTIATVDATGKITAISAGRVTITAKYNEKTINMTVDVNEANIDDPENTGIRILNGIVEEDKYIDEEYPFVIYLSNIPEEEKENIRISIENEEIAKIQEIRLLNEEGERLEGYILATVKMLSTGRTTMTISLTYNGTIYTDAYAFEVKEAEYSLTITTKDYFDLPGALEVGKKLQLIAELEKKYSATDPVDVTTRGTVWSSSDENVVKVDEKGLVTAIAKGSAIISAAYEKDGTILTDTYRITITEQQTETTTKPTGDDTTSKKTIPDTGKNIIIITISIITTIIVISIVYKKVIDYKEVR